MLFINSNSSSINFFVVKKKISSILLRMLKLPEIEYFSWYDNDES